MNTKRRIIPYVDSFITTCVPNRWRANIDVAMLARITSVSGAYRGNHTPWLYDRLNFDFIPVYPRTHIRLRNNGMSGFLLRSNSIHGS